MNNLKLSFCCDWVLLENALKSLASCVWITVLSPTVTISVWISAVIWREHMLMDNAMTKLHCNCYSMQLLRITQPLVLIIYAKCWRIKKTWSSSGRLPGALSSAHDLCINTGWQKEDLSLLEFLPRLTGAESNMPEEASWIYTQMSKQQAAVALVLTNLRESRQGDKEANFVIWHYCQGC